MPRLNASGIQLADMKWTHYNVSLQVSNQIKRNQIKSYSVQTIHPKHNKTLQSSKHAEQQIYANCIVYNTVAPTP